MMVEEMVSLVVESPLADGQSGSTIFYLNFEINTIKWGEYLFDHRFESFFLILTQFQEVFGRGNVELMLGLGLWGLERAGQDSDLETKFVEIF